MDSEPTTIPPNASVPPIPPPPPPPPPPPSGSQVAAAPESVPQGYISNPFGLVKPGWEAIKLNVWALIIPTLVFILVLFVVGVIFGVTVGSSLAQDPLSAIIGLIVPLLVVFLLIVAISIIFAPYPILVSLASLKGEKVHMVETLRRAPRYAGRFFMIGLLAGLPLLIAVGAMLVLLMVMGVAGGSSSGTAASALIFIVGGLGVIVGVIMTFIRIIRFALAPYMVVERDMSAKEAIAESQSLVKGHMTEMAGLMLMPSTFIIIPVLGSIASIVLSIISPTATLIRYHQLSALKSSGAPKPKIHWANYVVIVLALVGGAVTNSNSTKPTPTLNPQDSGFELPAEDTTTPDSTIN